MATFNDKISNLLNSQVPDFVLEDHPLFLDFVKAYYSFLESAEIKLKTIGDPDHLQLDSAVGATNFFLLDATNTVFDDREDRILLEDTNVGDFINGEIITGSTSGATATILVEDVDGNSRLFVTHQNKFIEGETITGASSAATAVIEKYRANPVQNIQQLLDYADTDKTIQGFLIKFRNSFLSSIPDTLHSSVDKRKLIKNIKSLYRAKGTKRASEIFFKLLFNEDAEIRYPKENMLRVSDGKWETKKILRCIEQGNSDASNLIGQTITQANIVSDVNVNKATAIVEDVFKFIIGGVTVVEIILGYDSVVGNFVAGQTVTGVDNTDEDVIINLTLTGIIDERNVTNDGALYNTNDTIQLTAGGTGASLQISDVGLGKIQNVFVDDGGTNYEIGDNLNFSTGNAIAKVAIVNGSVELETATGSGNLVLETETTISDAYTGSDIVQESGVGDITKVRIIEEGNGYEALPSVTITSSSGANAKLLAYGPEIGRVLNLKVIDYGYDYQTSPSPTVILPTYLLLKDISGSFVANTTVTGLATDGVTTVTATVVSIDTSTNILKLSGTDGVYGNDITITASNGATATVLKNDQATATLTVSSVVTTDGEFINEDGWVSENTKKVQDSLLYQDYSYIIKVGRSINEWRDSYVKTLHPSGFYFQSEISIVERASVQIRNVTGVNTGDTGILLYLLSRVYSEVIGRRLGTQTDGTSLRANAKVAVSADLDDATITQFDKTTRDVTLKSEPIEIRYVSRIRRNIQNSSGTTIPNVRQGFAYAGFTFGSLNSRFNTSYGGSNANTLNSKVTIERLNELKVQGTNTSLDGSNAIFLMTSSSTGRKLKTKFAFPATVSRPGTTFDTSTQTFDYTGYTFDNSGAL